MYSAKYRLNKVEEFGKHNAIYDTLLGRVCYPSYLKVGEKGFLLYEVKIPDTWCSDLHRIQTSVVEDVKYLEDKIIVTTQNTRFTLGLIK